jgi:N-methylhydantoinase B
MTLDGAKVEVIRRYILSATEEVRRTLIRTAFSPGIYEVHDFGISIYDSNRELIAEAPGLAMFLGANDTAIRKAIDYIGVESLEPGDVVVMNYPYWNSAHVSDVTLYAGVFAPDDERQLIAYICIRAHWADLGAKDVGYVLDSTDMHQEGMVFPGTKIYKRGQPNKEIYELIRFNSRLPEIVFGDMEAQVTAIRAGEKRIREIYRKFGAEAYEAAIRQMFDYSDGIARRALQKLPQGTFEASDYIDDDGISSESIPIRVRITIDSSGVTIDFDGSSPPVRGPVNLPLGTVKGLCKYFFKSLTTPTLPADAGQFRALTVKVPENSIFNAQYPAATYLLWSANVTIELLYKAIASKAPECVAACSGGDIFGFATFGTRADGSFFGSGNNEAVGRGAAKTHDGASGVGHLAGAAVRNKPVEFLELNSNLFCEALEFTSDSGGAGEFRGGLGLTRKLRFVSPGDFLTVTKRSKSPPWACAGGHASQPNVAIYFPGSEKEKRVGTHRAAVQTGDRVIIRSAGGAGYGNPHRREPERVRQDVLDGYITEQAARTVYGVAIGNQALDHGATNILRGEK